MLSFTGNTLDRASDQRSDPVWLTAKKESGVFLPFWQTKPLLKGEPLVAQFVTAEKLPANLPTVFLGMDGDRPLFAVDLGSGERPPFGSVDSFYEMRAAAAMLSPSDTALCGQAKALLDWNARNGFCANCGHASESGDGGYRRSCPNCNAEHFARTDPVVIMLPLFEDRCLVGHNKRFHNARYSAFAGFIEPGEALEDAVRRELFEEAKVRVGAIRYFASQPWPFPSSLMLGCYADASAEDFKVDGEEIDDARWITREEALRFFDRASAPEMTLPDPIAIAHHLIKNWAENGPA